MQDELEILFPSLKIDDKKFDLKPGELDLFLVHVYHYIVYYQKEISKLEVSVMFRFCILRALSFSSNFKSLD